MRTVCEYEYAGFTYSIQTDGVDYHAKPIADEHPSAWREEHCRAALECWREDVRHQRVQMRQPC